MGLAPLWKLWDVGLYHPTDTRMIPRKAITTEAQSLTKSYSAMAPETVPDRWMRYRLRCRKMSGRTRSMKNSPKSLEKPFLISSSTTTPSKLNYYSEKREYFL